MNFFRKDKWAFRRTNWEVRTFVIVSVYAGASPTLPPLSALRGELMEILLCFLPGSEAAPKKGIMAASVPEISAFSQVMEAPKGLFLDPVNLKCF